MRRVFATIGKFLGTLILIGISTVFIFCGIFYFSYLEPLYQSEKTDLNLDATPVNLSSTIYYKDPDTGNYVEWYTLETTENRVWLDADEIPKSFGEAFIAIEDQRFRTHHGIDLKRTAAAGLTLLTGRRVFGGSTITQQLIKNLTGDNEVTINRKITEICRALKLEKNYSKDEILLWYMNIIYFGRGQYGIGAAADYYFGKEVKDLSLAEQCAIVGITNNPSLYDPYAFPQNNKKRQELILEKMQELGYISQYQKIAAQTEELVFADHGRSAGNTPIYPYYVDAVIEDVIGYFQAEKHISREQATFMLYHGGYKIRSCVDMDVQTVMDTFYQNTDNIPKTRDGKPLQSSMVIIDPQTGDIVGLEGGVGEKTVSRGLNWATSSLGRRPPGSSLKPISVYAPAIDAGLITPDTLFLDSQSVKLDGTNWLPQNDSRKSYGVVSVRKGVTKSLNTIAAQVLSKLTPAASYQFLTSVLDMRLEAADDDYAPLAVGQLSIGTTARDMASAFTIFPNMGIYRKGRTFSAILDNDDHIVYENSVELRRAISEKTAYWMNDVLEDAVTYGTGAGAKLSGMHCAGKTGTTTDAKDRWFAGYTPYYVGVVWAGYEKPARIRIGSNPASTIWKKVMQQVHAGLEDKAFEKPEDIRLEPVLNHNVSSTAFG